MLKSINQKNPASPISNFSKPRIPLADIDSYYERVMNVGNKSKRMRQNSGMNNNQERGLTEDLSHVNEDALSPGLKNQWE